MGQGSFCIVEFDSIAKQDPRYQRALKSLETRAVNYTAQKWFPRKTVAEAFGYLTPETGKQFGRTTIIPALFDGQFAGGTVPGLNPMPTWRQFMSVTGHQLLITGGHAGYTIPEDFIVAWAGLAFPNKNQHITEIKWQIGDRKYGRINLEEFQGYNKPAIIFEEGFIIDEEESFDMYGYVEGDHQNNLLPLSHDGVRGVWQRVVMLGFVNYKIISKLLGNPGAAI